MIRTKLIAFVPEEKELSGSEVEEASDLHPTQQSCSGKARSLFSKHCLGLVGSRGCSWDPS